MEPAWKQILAYAHRYPSPHNSQPMKVRIDGDTLHLFYDTARGLPAEPYGIPFGSVCAGVFIEAVTIAAHALHLDVVERLDYTPMDFQSAPSLHPLGELRLVPNGDAPEDLDPELMLSRRTSRLPYEKRSVPEDVLREASEEVARAGHVLRAVTDPRLVKDVVAINQRTLFYDLENPDVRREIQGYLRYSEREAVDKADGLSASCLGLPGPVMRLVMGNYWVWRMPVLSTVMRRVYLSSMRGVSQVAWLKGPFASESDYINAGRALLRMWLLFTSHGVYLQPFGSVITNPRAHRELVTLVEEHENGDVVWLLFRLGYSKQPPRSHRRPLDELEVPS